LAKSKSSFDPVLKAPRPWPAWPEEKKEKEKGRLFISEKPQQSTLMHTAQMTHQYQINRKHILALSVD